MINKINHNLHEILINALDENTTYHEIVSNLEIQEIKNLIVQIENRLVCGFLFKNKLVSGYDKQFYKSLLKHTKGILEKAEKWRKKDHE